MADNFELNRLLWRCRRGMRELDALLIGFAARQYTVATPAEQAAFCDLLNSPDPDILALLIGRQRTENPALARVISAILEKRLSRTAGNQLRT